ncbi:MAG: ABC-2 family transporter protein [Bacteriovoracaceae bacterium]|nr:ABC-2 family transporter protein [Bacteriovoracaceae bacterium]
MNWWRFVVANEIRKILAFRSDFWVTFLGQTLVLILIARALWQSIFAANNTEVMEGFTLPMMTLYYIIVPIGNKILTGENVGFLAREIYDGSFNRYLVYPISFFQYKTLTYLTHSVFYALQLVLIYLLFNFFTPEGITLNLLANLAAGVSVFIFASYVFCMLAMAIELISLWADNIWSLMVMVRFFVYFLGGSYMPLNFFPDWAEKILNYTPFPYLVSLPIRTTMGLASSSEIQQGLILLLSWAILFHLMAKLLWHKGESRYSGVGI